MRYYREFVDYMPDAPSVNLEPCDCALTVWEDENGHIELQFHLTKADIAEIRHYIDDAIRESKSRGFEASHTKRFRRKDTMSLRARSNLNDGQRMWLKTLILILRFPTEDEQVVGREEWNDETVNQMLSLPTTK